VPVAGDRPPIAVMAHVGCIPTRRPVEVLTIMRSRPRSERCGLAGSLSAHPGADRHPSTRAAPAALADRDSCEVMLVRLATGCSWEDAERLCGNAVSDTTVRSRRDEWIEAGVYEAIAYEALCACDRVIGLDLSDVAVDGSQHKAPQVVRERARTRRTGPSSAGNGRCSPTPTASRSDGRSMVPTATTRCSCPPRSPLPGDGACLKRSRPSGSTVAMTRHRARRTHFLGHR
jgi:transposase